MNIIKAAVALAVGGIVAAQVSAVWGKLKAGTEPYDPFGAEEEEEGGTIVMTTSGNDMRTSFSLVSTGGASPTRRELVPTPFPLTSSQQT
jgi:hypothetical protein